MSGDPFFLIIIIVALAINTRAQTAPTLPRTVYGIVKSKGSPMAGVTVKVKGINVGTVTDIDGKYSLEFPDLQGSTKLFPIVIFSFLDKKREEQITNDARQIELNIELDSKSKSKKIN